MLFICLAPNMDFSFVSSAWNLSSPLPEGATGFWIQKVGSDEIIAFTIASLKFKDANEPQSLTQEIVLHLGIVWRVRQNVEQIPE